MGCGLRVEERYVADQGDDVATARLDGRHEDAKEKPRIRGPEEAVGGRECAERDCDGRPGPGSRRRCWQEEDSWTTGTGSGVRRNLSGREVRRELNRTIPSQQYGFEVFHGEIAPIKRHRSSLQSPTYGATAVSLARRTKTYFFDNLEDSECGYLAALPLESHANDAHC